MRCLVSILFILLLMTGMSSCRRTAAPVHYEVPVEAEDSLDADTLREESSEMRELEASLNLDRVFDDFMYAFVRSPRLQRERVHYPLPVVTADSLQDTLVRYLDCASEFGFMMGDFYTLLFSHPSQMEESKSADEETVRVERINLHEMQVRSFDFERRHGKWMLIGLEDKGVGQSDCADFLEFYAHFSTDSLFQSRHLARRLRFSMLPGDSTASYTTIDAVYATTPCKGDFIVASKDPSEIGFYPYLDQSSYEDLYLHDRPQLDEEGHLLPSKILDSAPSEDRIVEWKPEYWIKDNNGKIIGKVPLTERGEPLHLGDDLLIPPASQIVITIQSHYRRKDDSFDDDRTFRSLYTINAETLANNETDKAKYWDEEKQEYRFKPGYIYDITLVVYGLQKIEVTANIEAWKEGGEVVIDPDDADDSWTINP